MTAETIAKSLGGRKAGGKWMAPCPAHNDRNPSLSIADGDNGKPLVHCHAGCEQRRVIAALHARGIWDTGDKCSSRFLRKPDRKPPPDSASDCLERTEAALAIWRSSRSAEGTPVETYLRSRGLRITAPTSIRFHAGLKHPSGGIWPAMVALVTRGTDGVALAVHRTFLNRDGCNKAPVEPVKMMLGPCRGGAVRLGPISDRLMIAEGIETALSAMQATGQVAWAALSTSALRRLELLPGIRDVVVLADGDDAGESAAWDAARRWKREARCVRIARPPRGLDFNDVLLGRACCRMDGSA